MCFSFRCLQSKAWAAPQATTLVSAWKTNLFYRLETFVPIRKTNLSPVERFVSIPKQTPDCIPTVAEAQNPNVLNLVMKHTNVAIWGLSQNVLKQS